VPAIEGYDEDPREIDAIPSGGVVTGTTDRGTPRRSARWTIISSRTSDPAHTKAPRKGAGEFRGHGGGGVNRMMTRVEPSGDQPPEAVEVLVGGDAQDIKRRRDRDSNTNDERG
jgi:hypothetical protein